MKKSNKVGIDGKTWRFKIGDKVELRKGNRDKQLQGVVEDRGFDGVGVEKIYVRCNESGWWQADWWIPKGDTE